MAIRQELQVQDSLVQDSMVRETLQQGAAVRDTLEKNIPVRDTLSCATLPADTQACDTLKPRTEWLVPSVDSCVRATDYQGHFAWVEELPFLSKGKEAETFSASYHRADFYTLMLLAGLVLVMGVWRGSFRYIKAQVMQFFFPLRQTSTSSQAEVAPPTPQRPLSVLLLASMALLGFRWFDDNYNYLYADALQPYLLYLFLCLAMALYLVGNLLLHAFVHGLFFSPAQRQVWHDSYALVLCVEGTLSFSVIFFGFLLRVPVEVLFEVVLGVVACSKLLLLYKAKCIFFCGLYGYFHVLLYLCTLEIAPLLIFSKILMNLLEQSDIVIH